MVDLTESIFSYVRYLRFSEGTAFLSFIFSLCADAGSEKESSRASRVLLCFASNNGRTNERTE